MTKIFSALLFVLLIQAGVQGQTLVATYEFPRYAPYNSFYGITEVNDTLWIGTSNGGSLYKVTKTGQIVDSVSTEVTFNQGLAWDGSGFWVARNVTSNAWRFFKLNMQGQKVDSISIPSLLGATSLGLSGLSIEGNGMWFAVYSPDYTVYPFGYAFKIDLTTHQITDTIPLRGRQVLGITVKGVGDTIIYVNDFFHTTPAPDPERIYVYSRFTGDTVLSFPTPDPDGDCQPRGMHWDGQYLYLIADRIGNNQFLYRALYVYDLAGQGNPQIITNTNALDFGNTIIGSPTNRFIDVTNNGTANLILTSGSFNGPLFNVSPNTFPDTLLPSQTKMYTVTFSPVSYGNVIDTLKFASNDMGMPIKRITLTGKGVQNGAFISSSIGAMNYGNRRVNSLSGGYLDITNQGSQTLTINSVNIGSSAFRFDTTGIGLPIQIDSQRTRTLRIWFNPLSATPFQDTATFNSNAVNISALKLPLSGVGVGEQTSLGDIMWDGMIPDHPSTTFQDKKPASIREIQDVNGDGVNDVIVATRNYWTICFNGNSSGNSDTLWKFSTYRGSNNTGSVSDFYNALQVRSDVNGDGIQDVVIGTSGGNEFVYTICGRTGNEIWGYGDSINFSNGDINGVRVDKDFNGDGIPDVLVSASGEANFTGRRSVICLDGVTGNVIFNVQQTSNFLYDVQTMPLGGAVSLVNNSGPYSTNGFSNTGQALWSYSTAGATSGLNLIPDINGDGNPEIVGFSGFNSRVFVITSDAGAELWAQNYGNSIFGNIFLLDDHDGNGFIDMTFSGTQVLYRVNSNNGSTVWLNPLDGNYIHGVAIGSDVNGDGIHDLAAGTQNGNFYIVRGDNGQTLFTYSFGSGSNFTVQKIAAIESIDENISTEFVAGSRNGRIVCFSGGPNGIVSLEPVTAEIPQAFDLKQNYPNPFNPVTKISFDLPQISDVKLKIFDAIGREVAVLVNQQLQPGTYQFDFDASKYASGVYFYRIETADFVATKRMMLIK